MINLLLLLLGIGLLTIGGEALIRGALGLARRFGVSPMLSGLVIVGFGTSMPEMAVSVDAALREQPDIAVGNVVGSNIANVLLILGLCALISPMAVSALALRRDAATVIAASVLYLLLARDALLARPEGLLLLLALLAYLVWAWRSERDRAAPSAAVHAAEAEEVDHVPATAAVSLGAVIAGLVLLIAGSRVLLAGAIGVAQGLGVSEALIGLTLVAVGTSLPELTVSVIAALRRHADVAVGNILGSNIFNLLGILGVSALVQPLAVAGRIAAVDQWVMLGAALLLTLFLLTGRRLSRGEGGLLLAAYVAYTAASVLLIDA